MMDRRSFLGAFAGGLAMCPAGPELFDFFAAVGAALVAGSQISSIGSSHGFRLAVAVAADGDVVAGEQPAELLIAAC